MRKYTTQSKSQAKRIKSLSAKTKSELKNLERELVSLMRTHPISLGGVSDELVATNLVREMVLTRHPDAWHSMSGERKITHVIIRERFGNEVPISDECDSEFGAWKSALERINK